jgi:hypothetical protein
VPAVRPVGNAPVVVNAIAVPFAGAVVTVTTAGVAIVIVAACAVLVSDTDQFVRLTGIVANKFCTKAVVANCVLFEPVGGVTAKDTVLTVCTPEPAAVTFTSGLSVDDVEIKNVVALILDT